MERQDTDAPIKAKPIRGGTDRDKKTPWKTNHRVRVIPHSRGEQGKEDWRTGYLTLHPHCQCKYHHGEVKGESFADLEKGQS
jgi:hypothetical protein